MAHTALSPDLAARGCGSAPLVSRDGNRTVIWLDGEHDIATVAALADTLANATSAHDGILIVDLSNVTFMSIATIDELIRARKLLLGLSRNLTLRSPSKRARRVLELTGLARLIEPNEDTTGSGLDRGEVWTTPEALPPERAWPAGRSGAG